MSENKPEISGSSEASSGHETVQGKKMPSRLRRWLKRSLYVLVVLALACIPAHFMWKASGDGQWKLKYDKNGIQLSTRKDPNSTWLKYKVTGTVKTSMSSVIKLMRDPKAAEDVGCFDGHMIDSVSPELMFYTFKQEFFPPFKVREYLVKSEFTQDSATKEINIAFISAPDVLPEDNCCYRVEEMHNTWRFRPVGNGVIEYEFQYGSIDPGGNFPYVLANLLMPMMLPPSFELMPELLAKPKYQEAKIDYVQEVQ